MSRRTGFAVLLGSIVIVLVIASGTVPQALSQAQPAMPHVPQDTPTVLVNDLVAEWTVGGGMALCAASPRTAASPSR